MNFSAQLASELAPFAIANRIFRVVGRAAGAEAGHFEVIPGGGVAGPVPPTPTAVCCSAEAEV
jgi:hypothetical protein